MEVLTMPGRDGTGPNVTGGCAGGGRGQGSGVRRGGRGPCGQNAGERGVPGAGRGNGTGQNGKGQPVNTNRP